MIARQAEVSLNFYTGDGSIGLMPGRWRASRQVGEETRG